MFPVHYLFRNHLHHVSTEGHESPETRSTLSPRMSRRGRDSALGSTKAACCHCSCSGALEGTGPQQGVRKKVQGHL